MNWFLIVEILLYIFHFSMFLMLIIKRKGFSGAFFDIFRTVLAADLLCYVCTFVVMKLPNIFGFGQFDPLVSTIILAASLYFAIMEFLGHLLLAYNRFTLLWFPRTMIWQNRWYLWILFCFPLIQAIFQFTPYVLTFSSLTLIGTTGFAAIFNTLTFLKLYIAQHSKNNTPKVKEMNLMIVSFVIFIAQVLRSSYDVSINFGSKETQQFFFSIFPILQCIFVISGSISMLILSKKTRTSYFTFYFPKLFGPSKTIIITVSRAQTKSSVNRF